MMGPGMFDEAWRGLVGLVILLAVVAFVVGAVLVPFGWRGLLWLAQLIVGAG